MSDLLLIYGATGYSGQRIAEAAAELPAARGPVVLAGRDARALSRLAGRLGLQWRAFPLDEPRMVRRGLAGVRAVLNAAGPFALTAERLAKSAIAAGCDYVDINGELAVQRRLDALGRVATTRGTALVSGAGFTAAVSSTLLEQALQGPLLDVDDLGTVRVGFTAPNLLSRGSLETAWRSVREQVMVIRPDPDHPGGSAPAWVPLGSLARNFSFQVDRAGLRRDATATAISLIDTLVAWRSLQQRRKRVQAIESYVEAGPWRQLANDAGALAAPLTGVGWLRRAAGLAIRMLPEGPTGRERTNERASVVLQVEDARSRMLVDWCVQAPNPYDATAPLALAIAQVLRSTPRRWIGWRTPGEVLIEGQDALVERAWRGFTIVRRAGDLS